MASLDGAFLQYKVELSELTGVAAFKDGHLPQESQLLSRQRQLQLGNISVDGLNVVVLSFVAVTDGMHCMQTNAGCMQNLSSAH